MAATVCWKRILPQCKEKGHRTEKLKRHPFRLMPWLSLTYSWDWKELEVGRIEKKLALMCSHKNAEAVTTRILQKRDTY